MTLETAAQRLQAELRSNIPFGALGLDVLTILALAELILSLIASCASRGTSNAELIRRAKHPNLMQKLAVRSVIRQQLGLSFRDPEVARITDAVFRLAGQASDAEIEAVIEEAKAA